MLFYVFNLEEDANAAAQLIIDNVRNWVSSNVPAALSEDGTKLRGRNAATTALVDVYTERWAFPAQTVDNRWVFLKPTEEKTAPIPLAVFIAGITAAEEEYDPAWFPVVVVADAE